MKKLGILLACILCAVFVFVGCKNQSQVKTNGSPPKSAVSGVDKNGSYTDKERVASYIHEYKKLPGNFITKTEAKKRGWPHKGTLDKVAPGKSIGGDHFGNHEGKLPKASGLKYIECDIDYVKGNRGAKRIVYDNKGSIYYCGDHYNTFQKLY